jgi:hypothetical protein
MNGIGRAPCRPRAPAGRLREARRCRETRPARPGPTDGAGTGGPRPHRPRRGGPPPPVHLQAPAHLGRRPDVLASHVLSPGQEPGLGAHPLMESVRHGRHPIRGGSPVRMDVRPRHGAVRGAAVRPGHPGHDRAAADARRARDVLVRPGRRVVETVGDRGRRGPRAGVGRLRTGPVTAVRGFPGVDGRAACRVRLLLPSGALVESAGVAGGLAGPGAGVVGWVLGGRRVLRAGPSLLAA